MADEKKKLTIKQKLILNKILGYSLLILPVLTVVCVNWKKYFTRTNGVSITIGVVVASVCVCLGILKKFEIFKGFVGETIILVLAYTLNSIIDQFLLLYTVFYVSDIIYRLAFQKRIKYLEDMQKGIDEYKATKDFKREDNLELIDELAKRLKGSV